jgi:hypothetical protein
MRVLVACEFTGIVRSAFRALGHDAYSCDLEPSEYEPEYHIQGDVLGVLNDGWELMVAHPPCTYLSNSGVQYLDAKVGRMVSGNARWMAMAAAAKLFNALKSAAIPKIAIENPIPHKYAKVLIGSYDQRVQPWQFGHGETKATCLWLKNLPPLTPTELCIGREKTLLNASRIERGAARSRTYPGIAVAMARQWGEA